MLTREERDQRDAARKVLRDQDDLGVVPSRILDEPASAPPQPLPKLRMLDLFSGIGGFSLGLESTGGFETVAFCEISPKCRFLLNYHWPNVPCFDDVRTLEGADVGEVEVICGGFPCQDISFAGRGAGIEGERSGLWREFARLIGELRPGFVIVENVSALLVRGMGTVLGDLAALGYDAWWDCIPASAVGAPHRRDRLWLVAYARGQQYQGFGNAFRRAITEELARHADEQSKPTFALDDEAPRLPRLVANTARHEPGRAHQRAERERVGASGESVALADASSRGTRRWRHGADQEPVCGGPLGNADIIAAGQYAEGVQAWQPELGRSGWWLSEPDVGRVAHGVPARVDRLHGLGNAVVPQIPALIGRAILKSIGTPTC